MSITQNPSEKVPEYGFYLVGFFDILGQRDAFEGIKGVPGDSDSEAKQRLIEALKKTVGFIDAFRMGFKRHFESTPFNEEFYKTLTVDQKRTYDQMRGVDVKFQVISDAVVPYVSMLGDNAQCRPANGVYQTFFAACGMTILSLGHQHAIRGGMDVEGAIEWMPGEIYGPAFYNSYILESRDAVLPRILIGDGLRDYLLTLQNPPANDPLHRHSSNMAKLCLRMIGKDFDGKLILDYLGDAFREEAKSVDSTLLAPAYNFINSQLVKWESMRKDDRAEKYRYLKAYWDQRMPKWPASVAS